MIKDVDVYLLTDSLNTKCIVKVRRFSFAKKSDMEYFITPKKRDFNPGIYILHAGTNNQTLDNTHEEIAAAAKKEIPLVNHDKINTKRQLNKSRLHLNAHGKSIFVRTLKKFLKNFN